MSLSRILREDAEAALEPHGISLCHLSTPGRLRHQPGPSCSEPARRAGVTPRSMQATLVHLEGLAAVERRTPPGRGRRAELHVTPQDWTSSPRDGVLSTAPARRSWRPCPRSSRKS